MSELNCQFDFGSGEKAQQLTVGDVFSLNCDGEIGAPLKENAQFVFEIEELTYTLHVLKVKEATAQNVKLLVTSYKPGDYTNQSLKISDGQTTAITQGVSWRVNSIVNPQDPNTKPFPSQGPFMISYPLWFWLAIAGVVLAVLSFLGWFFYRRTRMQKLKAEIDSYMTMLAPFSQFSRDMRGLAKQIERLKPETSRASVVQKLSEDFRFYLVRELKVPAHKYSDSQILREIKKNHRSVYDQGYSDIRRVLSELAKANQDLDKIQNKDCEDLFYLSRTVAEKIYNLKRKAK